MTRSEYDNGITVDRAPRPPVKPTVAVVCWNVDTLSFRHWQATESNAFVFDQTGGLPAMLKKASICAALDRR